MQKLGSRCYAPTLSSPSFVSWSRPLLLIRPALVLSRLGAALSGLPPTLDGVDYVFYANLANINTAMRGGLLSLIELKLMCVGAGPTLDFADATAFLAAFNKLIDVVRKRYLH